MTAESARETLLVEHPRRGLLRLVLNRPERGTAIGSTMSRELLDELASAEADPNVRFIAITGKGKHFCSGAEIGGAKTAAEAPRLSDLLLRVDSFPKPTAAFVQGACLGAALALVSCCDVAVAAPDAFFAIPEVRLGMVPGLLPFFVRAVGSRAFRRYGLSGERFDARAAERCGLVGEVADTAAFPTREAELLDAFLHAGPQTLAIVKREAAKFSGFDVSADLFTDARRLESSEAEEGKASFKDKRRPNWWIES
jgi:methylglutaconyl-CoA hydratase